MGVSTLGFLKMAQGGDASGVKSASGATHPWPLPFNRERAPAPNSETCDFSSHPPPWARPGPAG